MYVSIYTANTTMAATKQNKIVDFILNVSLDNLNCSQIMMFDVIDAAVYILSQIATHHQI